MKTTSIRIATALALAAAGANAHADATFGSGTPPSAAVNLDFSIVVPGLLYFRVGTDIAGHVNQLTFTPTTANVGTSAPMGGTGGDSAASAVNVAIRANVGQVTITESNNSGGNGLGTGVAADGFIPYTEIFTTSSDGALPPPSLSNVGGNTSQPALSSGKVTTRTAVWTYGYHNRILPAPGTYGAGGGSGGRVTYTATAP